MDYDFTLQKDAKKFEEGTPNTISIHAFGAALGLLLEAGIDNIEKRVITLGDYIIAELNRRNIKIYSSTLLNERSGNISFILDKDMELGRSVVRAYLDDLPETSFLMLRNIRASLLSMIPQKQTDFWNRLYDMTLVALVSEQFLHHICDQVIDICIGGDGWTLGDCVQSMAALSGKYHAKVIEVYNLGVSKKAVIEHDFDYMINTMMNEAMRLGMPDTAGLYTMLAANDVQPFIPYAKADAINIIADPIFKIFHILDSDLRSMMLAKATGRMMAVAAAGETPDMDVCVVTPLALSSMQGSYISFLNRG